MIFLPDDLVAKILNVSDQTARMSALVVNKSMSRVVSTCGDVWTEITFRKLGAKEREFFVARQIQKLSLDGVIPEEVQHLFRLASNLSFSKAVAFDRLETLDVTMASVVRLPVDFGSHMGLLPRLRHLRIATNEIERESTFVVRGFEHLETFEFCELGGSPMVDVSFETWNFPHLRDVWITCDQTNFADGAAYVPTLKRLSLRPYYATFENARWGGPLDFLELNVAENTNDDALSGIRDAKHLVLRITESVYMNFRVTQSVDRITFLLAASDCLLEFECAATSEARVVRIVGEHDPMSPWNVIVHGTNFRSIREFCSKTDVGDDVLVLLTSARINVKIRHEYGKRRRTYDTKYFTYALLLQDGKIYVGETNNVYQRLLEHFTMSPSSSLWVREHGPVRRVLEITSNAPDGAEEERTLDYMTTFGWENVRGSGWCRMRMMGPPVKLETHERGVMKHAFMPRKDVDDVVEQVEELISELNA